MANPTIVLVSRSDSVRARVAKMLASTRVQLTYATDAPTARDLLDKRMADAVVVQQPADEPPEWSILAKHSWRAPVIVLAEKASIAGAVQALRNGASDYHPLEQDGTALIASLHRLVEDDFDQPLVAESPSVRDALKLAHRVANRDATVLLHGESGTGKEVFARYIHANSTRRQGPFVAVNCAAIPENMLEAVLFGYEKGAFTGAHRSHAGKFEQAQGGSILLDEISEIDLNLQAKLLRVLQERETERLCGHRTIQLDVRVIATTNRDLRTLVKAGKFREDLFYRLHVFPITLPPLRERADDIRSLATRFLNRYAGVGEMASLSEAAMDKLVQHTWPGNVRELENVIQRALILADASKIGADAIRFDDEEALSSASGADQSLNDEVRSRENELIIETLRSVKGSRKLTAKKLGISDRTLRYKLARMRDHGVSIPDAGDAQCA